MTSKYLLISPCRNESKYLQKTIDSIVNQSCLPSHWIIVDDGSTDGTEVILNEAAKKHKFIQIIKRSDRGTRLVGPGVIDAFYTGYESINVQKFDYICKLDVDLEIPNKYFETLICRMENNLRIATCSGKPYFHNQNGDLVSEKCGDDTSVGMIKFYRRKSFELIGGFVREVMWDGIDCHRCRMLGQIACSWDEPDLRFIHLRPMGSSHKNIFVGRFRHGTGQYFMGTSLIYMLASCFYRMAAPPVVLGGTAMMIGYLQSMLLSKKRYGDLEFRSFLKKYQWNCLLRGKTKTLSHYDRIGSDTFNRLQNSES